MKNIFIIFFLVITSVTAQKNDLVKKYVQEENQIKFIEYFSNGTISQTGYIIDGKNHGIWISYDKNGNRLSEGNYINGKKENRWLFWNNLKLLEVTYQDNKILNAIKWDNSEILENNKIVIKNK